MTIKAYVVIDNYDYYDFHGDLRNNKKPVKAFTDVDKANDFAKKDPDYEVEEIDLELD